MSDLPNLSKLARRSQPCAVNLERWEDRHTNEAVQKHRLRDKIMEADTCYICLESLSEKAGTAQGTYNVWALTELSSGECFHTSCLAKMIRGGRNRCPVSDLPISPEVQAQILAVAGPPVPARPTHPWVREWATPPPPPPPSLFQGGRLLQPVVDPNADPAWLRVATQIRIIQDRHRRDGTSPIDDDTLRGPSMIVMMIESGLYRPLALSKFHLELQAIRRGANRIILDDDEPTPAYLREVMGVFYENVRVLALVPNTVYNPEEPESEVLRNELRGYRRALQALEHITLVSGDELPSPEIINTLFQYIEEFLQGRQRPLSQIREQARALAIPAFGGPPAPPGGRVNRSRGAYLRLATEIEQLVTNPVDRTGRWRGTFFLRR